jgi:hypothetical protein
MAEKLLLYRSDLQSVPLESRPLISSTAGAALDS